MLYTAGDQEDIKSHEKYHKQTLKVGKYKKETIVEDFFDGNVIIQLDLRTQFGMKTFNLTLVKINKELGDVEGMVKENIDPHIKVFLYIDHHKNEIVGCCIAEIIKEASKIIPNKFGLASANKMNALCGIQKIWVDKRFRKRGIATSLIDAVRKNLIYSFIVPIDKIAFTAPTADGRIFAGKYCKTDSFLVY